MPGTNDTWVAIGVGCQEPKGQGTRERGSPLESTPSGISRYLPVPHKCAVQCRSRPLLPGARTKGLEAGSETPNAQKATVRLSIFPTYNQLDSTKLPMDPLCQIFDNGGRASLIKQSALHSKVIRENKIWRKKTENKADSEMMTDFSYIFSSQKFVWSTLLLVRYV